MIASSPRVASFFGICAAVSLALLTLPQTANAVSPGVISTFAGGGPNNLPATSANLPYPVYTAVDSAGNFYIASFQQSRVFKVNTSGTLTVVAGTGFAGYNGTGGLATPTELYNPKGIAVDSSGNVYIADESNQVIRKVTVSTGIINTIAGTAQSCSSTGDGGAATSAHLCNPTGVALDSSGNVYIADNSNNKIRKVTISTGKISTVAGNGSAGFLGDGGAATSAELNQPFDVAVDGSGNFYIADYANVRVRKVTASTGKISTVAGTGTAGYSGDGGAGTSAEINYPQGVAADFSGKVFIGDTNNCVIREVNTSDIISTVAGRGQTCGFAGDGSTATSAELSSPVGVAVNGSDTMFIADYYNFRIRKAILGGAITTVAGGGSANYAGNGTPANGSVLYYPSASVPDTLGNVYITDYDNCVIRKVNSSGIITTIAGIPQSCGYSGDGGAATSAHLNVPVKAIGDSFGNVYITDTNNCLVRKVTASTGKISTYAGDSAKGCGFSGDGGAATSAQLYEPYGLALDSGNNLYIADYVNQRIRKVTSAGIISTIAGTGKAGYTGDGGLATAAELYYPTDVALDPVTGVIYIADRSNYRIRSISGGIIDTFAGNGAAGFESDGVPARDSSLYNPSEVAVDAAGDVLISDFSNQRIRWVNGAGIIQTVAGSGNYGFSGDGEPATTSCPPGSPPSCVPVDLANPFGVGVDPSGNIYIADQYNFRIREIAAIPNLNASAYALNFEEQSVGTTSDPQAITLRVVGTVNIDSISTTGDFTEADDCSSPMNSGTNCQVDITFSPSAVGTRTGTLTISTNSFFNGAITVKLAGTGEGLMYTPAILNFGNQAVGTTSSAHTVTFTNDSSSAVTFSSVTTTKTTYAIGSNTCTGNLSAGASCAIGVTFKPLASGLVDASLVVKDSDSTSPQLIPLRGTGVGTSLSPSLQNNNHLR